MLFGDNGESNGNDAAIQNTTVSLVSSHPRFRCSGCTIELNTSLENAWSTKLISVVVSSNRGQLGELE